MLLRSDSQNLQGTFPCFLVRTGFRRQAISYALARAAVDFARQRGARALEGYPIDF